MSEKQKELIETGKQLITKIKENAKNGHAKKIAIRNKNGRTIISFPVIVGIVTIALFPLLSTLGVVAALAAKHKIIIENQTPVTNEHHPQKRRA